MATNRLSKRVSHLQQPLPVLALVAALMRIHRRKAEQLELRLMAKRGA